MALGVIDITGMTNSLVLLYGVCLLNLILVSILFIYWSEQRKVVRILVDRMAVIENLYIEHVGLNRPGRGMDMPGSADHDDAAAAGGMQQDRA